MGDIYIVLRLSSISILPQTINFLSRICCFFVGVYCWSIEVVTPAIERGERALPASHDERGRVQEVPNEVGGAYSGHSPLLIY